MLRALTPQQSLIERSPGCCSGHARLQQPLAGKDIETPRRVVCEALTLLWVQ